MGRKVIGVIGGSRCSPEIDRLAEEVGRRIAERGAVLICGGMGGVMAAACRGAQQAGGLTVGVLPGERATEANPFVEIPVVTGMGDARNVIIVRSAGAVIAVDGEYGTLSEMAFCLKFGVPVISLQSWDFDPGIVRASTAEEAVERALKAEKKR